MKPTPGHCLHYISHDGNEVAFFVHPDATLDEMLGSFERYLRACGYVFPADANMELVEAGFLDAKEPSEIRRDVETTISDEELIAKLKKQNEVLDELARQAQKLGFGY